MAPSAPLGAMPVGGPRVAERAVPECAASRYREHHRVAKRCCSSQTSKGLREASRHEVLTTKALAPGTRLGVREAIGYVGAGKPTPNRARALGSQAG